MNNRTDKRFEGDEHILYIYWKQTFKKLKTNLSTLKIAAILDLLMRINS